jgi:hypothetical protein
MRRRFAPSVIVAALGFLVSVGLALVAGWPLARPISIPAVEEAPTSRVAPLGPRSGGATEEQAGEAVTIASDPFRADRGPPKATLVLAGTPASDVTPPGSAQALVLIGTAVFPNGGGFATCQVGSEPARLVRIGESLAGYTLRAVAQGRATFRAESGEDVEVRVARTGS